MIHRINFNLQKIYYNLNYLVSAGRLGGSFGYSTLFPRNIRKRLPQNDSSDLFQPLENLHHFGLLSHRRAGKGGTSGIQHYFLERYRRNYPKTIHRINFNHQKVRLNLNYLVSAGRGGGSFGYSILFPRNIRKRLTQNDPSD